MTAPNETPKTTKANPKICFSYIRFSSGKQAKGNSTDRQLEIAPRIAREKGWELDENLSIADPSLSAYRKANLGPKGKLGAVLLGVQTHKIPKGSVMIVEALDRLTRAQLDEAYDLFRDLLRAAGSRPHKSGSTVRTASLNRISAVCSEIVLTVPRPY
jgi:hypothetical protein